MRSTTSKLIFVAVAFAAVFARGADAAADAACDTALSTAYSNVVTNSDCVASDAGVCPSTCKTALQAAEDACKDKEWTYDLDNSVKEWNDDAFTWYIYKVNAGRSEDGLDKQDACDAVIHDFLIASVRTCEQGYNLAASTSTDSDQLYYCTGGGGTDASTCNDKCQAYIDIMDTTCDVGASYNAADAKYDDQGIVMKVIEGDGPKGCKYVSTKVSPAGALRASLAVVSAVAAAVLAVA